MNTHSLTPFPLSVEVFNSIPLAAEGSSNPKVYESLHGETLNANIQLQSASLGDNRLFVVDAEPDEPGAMHSLDMTNNKSIMSALVGNQVSAICFNGCSSLSCLAFADPGSIRQLRANCFNDVVYSQIEIDLSSFTGLKQIDEFAFGVNIVNKHPRFKDNEIHIPRSVNMLYEHAIVYVSCDSFTFEPENRLSVYRSNANAHVIGGVLGGKLSSIVLNDNAVNYAELGNSSYTNLKLFASLPKTDYREMRFETLSACRFNNLEFSNSQRALSGSVYTFTNFPLSDLEDQDSDKFDAYKTLIPNISVLSAFTNAISLSALSVWVPTALYDAWKNNWNNTSVLYSYGPWEDRTTTRMLTFENDKSYLFTDKLSLEVSPKIQDLSGSVTLSAYDATPASNGQ